MDNENTPQPPAPDRINPVVPSTVVDPVTPSASPPMGDVPQPAVGEATLGARIGGFLIDAAIIFGLSMVVGQISGTLGVLLGYAYLLARDSLPFLDGQSIGKKALKIRAVTEDGRSLSGNWSPGILRNILLIIPFLGVLIELIVLLISQGKPGGLKRLGDQIGKTKVVAAP